MPNATIESLRNGGDLGTLRAILCGATPVITYSKKGGKQEQMKKLGIRDQTGSAVVLVFHPKVFDMLQRGMENNHSIKITNYRYTSTDHTIVVHGDTICSVLALPNYLTPEQTEEGRIQMYAPMQTLAKATKSPTKTRISTTGKIMKLFPTSPNSKRMVIKDLVEETESLVTLWQPHNNTTLELGQTISLYDAKISAFQGGSIDTVTGTSIQVEEAPLLLETYTGEILGCGHGQPHGLIELLLPHDGEETTFPADPEQFEEIQQYPLRTRVTVQVTNGIITGHDII